MVNLNPNIDPSTVKILVVDDIPLNVMLIEKMMAMQGVKALKANSGKVALEMIEQDCPDVVLLDIIMPEMNGYEVVEKIREKYTQEQLPIVMLSALNANDDVAKAKKLGANDFLTKPVVAERLFNTLFTILNERLG